jgi:creatinine amidohydrolase
MRWEGMGMAVEHRIEWMTWPEVSEAVVAQRIVLQPMGAIEQHGPHLPVDTDNLIAASLCDAVGSARPGEYVVAPPVPYGFNDHNMEFPGTVSIRPETLLAYLVDTGRSFATTGFRHIVFVNGHGSNGTIAELAARRITNETPARAAVTSSYALARTAVERDPGLRTSPAGGVAHACEFETSLYLHLAPHRVRADLIADELPTGFPDCVDHDWCGGGPLTFMTWYSQRTSSGTEGAPSHASADKGKRLFTACAGLLADVTRDFRDMRIPPRTDHRPQPAWSGGLTFPPPDPGSAEDTPGRR